MKKVIDYIKFLFIFIFCILILLTIAPIEIMLNLIFTFNSEDFLFSKCITWLCGLMKYE